MTKNAEENEDDLKTDAQTPQRRVRFETDDDVATDSNGIQHWTQWCENGETQTDNHDLLSSKSRCVTSSWRTHWLALRPWSFTASVCPVLIGSALAYRATDGEWSLLLLMSSLLTALAVHAAGNLVNTYFDYSLGVDSPHWCDDRTLVDCLLTPGEVELMATLLYALGTAAFVVTVLGTGGRAAFVLTIIFVLGMSGSFFYTGGGPLALKYRALGELLVFTVFGPVTVAFAFFAQLGEGNDVEQWLWLPLIYALPVALNTVAILHANNLRDAHNEAGRVVTVAIILGPKLARILLGLLLLAPYVIYTVLALHSSVVFLLPCLSAGEALKLVRVATRITTGKEDSLRRLPHRIARLNLVLGTLTVASILAAPRHIFVAT